MSSGKILQRRVTGLKAALALAAVAGLTSYSTAQENVMNAVSEPNRPVSVKYNSAKRKQLGNINTRCLPPEIKAVISTISSMFGEVKIISTHRPGAFVAGTRRLSLHSSCRAVDFHPSPGSYKAVFNYLLKNWNGGIGVYSGRMNHLHIDNGQRIVFYKRV